MLDASVIEEMKKQHYRHEFMDYEYYRSRRRWLYGKLEEIGHKLSGNIQSPSFEEKSGVYSTNNWIIMAIAEQDELKEELREVNRHLTRVDTWLSYFMSQQEPLKHDALKLYLVKNRATKLDECAQALGFATKKGLLSTIDRAINEIILKNL